MGLLEAGNRFARGAASQGVGCGKLQVFHGISGIARADEVGRESSRELGGAIRGQRLERQRHLLMQPDPPSRRQQPVEHLDMKRVHELIAIGHGAVRVFQRSGRPDELPDARQLQTHRFDLV